jgi:hypothetical protein
MLLAFYFLGGFFPLPLHGMVSLLDINALGLEPLDEELGYEGGTRSVAGLARKGVEEEDVDLSRNRDRDVALPVDCGDSV